MKGKRGRPKIYKPYEPCKTHLMINYVTEDRISSTGELVLEPSPGTYINIKIKNGPMINVMWPHRELYKRRIK